MKLTHPDVKPEPFTHMPEPWGKDARGYAGGTCSSRHRSESPVGCRGQGSCHTQDKAEPGHMTGTEMGDWPTGPTT